MSCVVKTKAFKETAKRLGISEALLEQIAYEYINQEEGNDFPSDSYVLSKMYGEENIVENDDQIKIWESRYNLPKIFETREQAEAYKADASRYFNPASIPVIELPNGSYKVQVNQPTKEKVGGVTILTPLKEEYKGKLIFAQSGTGKSTIADNVNVIDSDIILADIIGVTPESAIFVFHNMESAQKQRILERYKKAIQDTVESGKTVVTSNVNILNEANVIVYNANEEITNNRTNASDRQGGNRYSDIEYHSSVLEKIKNTVNNRPEAQSVRLSADKFLADYLLSDPTFKVVRDNQRMETLNDAVENFLEGFDMTVHSLEEYENSLPLFDALNRTINIKSEEDITEGMGYAIAFMMQHDPMVKTLILHKMFPGIESVPGISEGFISRLANREQGNIQIPQPLRRFVGGRKIVTYTEIYSRFPTKKFAIQAVGKEIAEALKQEYGFKPKKGLVSKLFDILATFFNKITRPSYEGIKASTIHSIVDSIVRGDNSLIRGSLYKPESTEKADLLDIETAFKENPYEEEIISKLGNEGIALTGSTAIRTEATIYRPSENPLHDIDFSCPNGTTRAGLEEILNRIFPNIQHVRSISSKDNSKNSTETYLILSRPYILKPHDTVPVLDLILDPKTGEKLGVMNLFKQEINLEEGVQGKLLDFFIGESPTIFEPKTKRIAGKQYLISDPRNAMLAKVTWLRKKDIWDYRNFIRIFNDNNISLKTKGLQADLNKTKANKWNLAPEAVKAVESKLKQYMQEKEGPVQDVNVSNYFPEGQTTAFDVLQYIINNSTNSDIVELANQVLDNLGNKANTLVKFNTKKTVGVRGRYTTTGYVQINRASLTGNTEAEAIRNMESTIVHEIVHAITVDAIETDANIRKDLISLFKDFKELAVQYGIDLGYAGKNPKEFVSEFLGRPAFREALKVIPSNTKKSWFSKVMDFIKSVLHIDSKSSFYDRADEVIEKLLNNSNTKDYSHIDTIAEDLNKAFIDKSEGSRHKVTELKDKRIQEVEKQLRNEQKVMNLMEAAFKDVLPREKARQLGKLRRDLKSFCDAYGVNMRMDDNFHIINNITTLEDELATLKQPNFEDIVVEQWHQQFAQERADDTQKELDLLFRDDYEEGVSEASANKEFIKSDILPAEILHTLNTVAERSTHITLDEATHVYTKDGKTLDTSATSILHDPWEAEKPVNGNTWLGYDVAGPLGTTTDVIMRDYFSGTLKKSYPNITDDQVKTFIENEAPKVREHLDNRFGKGNYEVITDDRFLRMAGTVFLPNPIRNKQGQVILSAGRHTIGATMDMLVVTKDGLYYPYDFKTKRANGGEVFSSNTYQQYSDLVSGVYPQLLEVQNPELKGRVQNGSLIQFNHKYEAPLGSRENERNGTGMYMKDAKGQVYRYRYNTTTNQWEYFPIQNAVAADGTPAYTPPTFYCIHENISGRRRNIIAYDAPTTLNPTYMVGMKEFNGMELVYGTIGVKDGVSIGAQNAQDGTIKVDISALKEKYETKAWKHSKRSEDIDRDFATFEDFVSFTLMHEYVHNYIRPVTISTAGYGTLTQDVSNQMNQARLQGSKELQNFLSKLPKDVYNTAIIYFQSAYGLDINLQPISKSLRENSKALYNAIYNRQPTATESTLSYETRVNNEALRLIDEQAQQKSLASQRELTEREQTIVSNINPAIKDFIGNPLDPAKIVVGDTVKDYLDNEFKVLGFIDENNVVLENSKGFISSKKLISTNKSTYLYKQNQEVLAPSATDTAPAVEGIIPIEAPSASASSTDEVFRFSEEQGKEFLSLFGPYNEGGGANINSLFKQSLPREVDNDISQYYWDGVYPSKSSIEWVLNNLKDEVKPALQSFFSSSVESGPLVTDTSIMVSSEDIDLGNDVPNYEKPAKQKEIDLEYVGKQKTIMEQMNTIMNHPDINPAEVRHIAEQCVYWISDRLTDYQINPEKLFDNFPNKKTLNAEKEWTDEAKLKDIEKVTNMSREDILRFIGIDNLYEACRNYVFVNNELIQNDFDLMDLADAIAENFSAIKILAADTFAAIEKFSIKLDERGNLSTTSDINRQENDNQRENELAQEYGNQQEHWQIESRTQDVLFSATEEVRRLLNNCYKMNPDGTIIDSKFGIHERMTAKDATSSILRWTQGSLDLNDMITKLQAKQAENPWIQQVIEKLLDRSGKYADLQSQFFGVMQKHFQPYCVVIKEDGVYKSIPVNEHPALTEATRSVKTLYNIGQHPLFNSNGVNKKSFKTLESLHKELLNFVRHSNPTTEDVEKMVNTVGSIAVILGYATLPEHIRAAISLRDKLISMEKSLSYIVASLSRQQDNENYNPFKFDKVGNPDGISGNLRDFLEPLTEQLEDVAVSSFYDSGKMYQSYVTPSYMTKLMNKFHDSQERFLSFIENEYGQYEWFREPGQRRLLDGWKNEWLRELVMQSEETRKELFKHKVELNFNKHNYMKNMSDSEYTLSLLTEYFSSPATQSKGKVLAWYNIPMLSNKPSSEFIQFYRYTSNYRGILTDGFYKVFLQELSRIQTCEKRASELPQDALIKSFDTFKKGTAKEKRGNGTKFMFLEFMNDYLEGGKQADSELGKIINKKLNGQELSPEQENILITKTKEAIQTRMDLEAESTLQKWEEQGILEGAKNIENIGSNEEEIKESIKQYVWNSTFASMNILLLTITDIAYYKDAEDLQKRLAQIHAPGIRANKLATDYEGNLVSDGNFRSLILTDWDNFKSNIISNLEEVFDKKINAASSKEKAQWKALKNNIIEAFSNINVADAQGFSSPTSYRKKAFLFGKWSRKYEDVYQKLMSGEYTYSDLEVAFLPLKPFVYSQNAEPSRVNAPMSQLKVGTQFKNSEYLLVLADAILKEEKTGRPNLLRAIYNIMEDSATLVGNTKGIDTVQFESTTKAGLKGKLNLIPFINHPNGEQAAYDYMKKAIFSSTVELREDVEHPVSVPGYNDVYVKTVDFEDYCLQQEVPEHFKDHSQAHGSQIRYIIPSDLEEYHSDGATPVKYSFIDRGVKKELSAEEFKKEYEDNIYQNILASIQELSEELGLGKFYTSMKDRNIALSKILQREILSSPRYGIDLLLACSVDETTGEFRIPLGDPIQSKRVEQLINSIIKNRINKQKIAGGPIVQVSNFGTSKELNIRFKDKNGKLLKTEAEFTPSEKYPTYKDYIKAEQAGIAYYEVFVPIYANELFKEFADDKGNINIEDIEAVSPDMLKMIGYRIPSEDKYSCAPMKVVGFLPREAGDGIMLPADITTITGSDFDVDKFYVMRKEILLSKRVEQGNFATKQEAEEDFIKKHEREILTHLRNSIKVAPISKEEKDAIRALVHDSFELQRSALKREYEDEVEKINNRNDQLAEAIDNAEYSKDAEKNDEIWEKKSDRLEKWLEKQLSRAEKLYNKKLERLQDKEDKTYFSKVDAARIRKTNAFLKEFLRNPHLEATNSSMRVLKSAYMNYMYRALEETEGRSYRNNKIVDMTWAVLTHETTAEKILNPGGFDEQKGMGYAVEAQRLHPELSWEYLEELSTTPDGINKLKDLCYTNKNICYPTVNIQFYKQNSAAGAALGMAAVLKVAHAVLEGDGLMLDIDAICDLPQNTPFIIAGKTFGGGQKMEMDPKFNDEGGLIGKTLGSEVAMFADAVKDPVANLMNINGMMMPIVNSLVRLGMPFRNVALFTSQSVIRECLLLFNTENISNYVSISTIINNKIAEIEKEYNLNQSVEEAEMSDINTEELTKEELIKGINPNTPKEEADAIAYKVLKMWQYISKIADAMRGPTFATRFNSIGNAVGPQIVDNLIMEYKQQLFSPYIYNIYDKQITILDIFDAHPILKGFNQTLDIARELFGNMPANSNAFMEVLSIAPESLQRKLYGDKKLLSQLNEFFLSYMLIANGTISTDRLKEYITLFPAEYLKEEYKKKYPNNALIQAIKPDYEKKSGRAILKVETTGLDTKQKEDLSVAWLDLHNQNPELSEKLFIYNFFKGGVVFSPKTFMALVHPLIKEKLFMDLGKSKYIETYRQTASVGNFASLILDLFIRNNWDNNKLVPKVKVNKSLNENGQLEFTSKEDISQYRDMLYMKSGFMNNYTLYKQVFADKSKVVFEQVQPLGNNHEFVEMSTENIKEALDVTTNPSEEDNNHDVPDQSRTDTADIIEEPIAKTEVQQQQDDILSIENLYRALATHPAIKTEETAESNVAEFKSRWETWDDSTKDAKKKHLMGVLLDRYKVIGINLNQEELERVFNLMC